MSTSTTITRSGTRSGIQSGRTARPARVPAQRTGGTVDRRPATPVKPSVVRRPAPSSVRLTRRGRVVVTVLLLGLILGAFVVFGGQSVATGEAGAPAPTRTVVVGEGDTLWAIASEVAEDGDIREVVHEIEQLNSLPGPVLEVGQEIAVPVG